MNFQNRLRHLDELLNSLKVNFLNVKKIKSKFGIFQGQFDLEDEAKVTNFQNRQRHFNDQ